VGKETLFEKKRRKRDTYPEKKDFRNDTEILKGRLEHETCILGGQENKEISGKREMYSRKKETKYVF